MRPITKDTEGNRYARSWYADNRDAVLAKLKAKREDPAHKAVLAERFRKWYEKNKVEAIRRKRPAAAAYYQKTKERAKVLRRKRYLADKEGHAEKCREYNLKHPDKISAYKRNYVNRRRVQAVGGEIDHRSINKWMASVRRKRRVVCYYCGNSISGRDCHFDHVIPISKGGPHCIGNLCVACPSCNLSKSDSLANEWYKPNQMVFGI